MAERITGRSVHPTAVQGGNSHTVIGGTLVQFLGYIEQAYRGFMPQHRSGGTLGELHICTMNDVDRRSMHLARDQLHQHNCYLLRQSLQDFARFVDTNVPNNLPPL